MTKRQDPRHDTPPPRTVQLAPLWYGVEGVGGGGGGAAAADDDGIHPERSIRCTENASSAAVGSFSAACSPSLPPSLPRRLLFLFLPAAAAAARRACWPFPFLLLLLSPSAGHKQAGRRRWAVGQAGIGVRNTLTLGGPVVDSVKSVGISVFPC